ncbi:MAG TPA: TRAP transporter substrate-binding protein [Rhodocyclaceae bacterium]|nr:TRAP transporter substrate-binding protein [Rhodocyclaceae bacterium]
MMKIAKQLTLAALLAASAGANAQQVVTLKVSHFLPPVASIQTKVIQPWCDTLEKESAGRLKCQIYPSMQLGGTPPQLVDQVKNGVADIVWTAPGYSSGRFPAIEAMELPFVITDSLSSSRAAWEFVQKYAAKEFDAYKVLAVQTDGGATLHAGDKDVKSLADFKGLKLRASTRLMSKTVAALGGTPVSMPPAQMTEAISKGVVNGAVSSWEVVLPTKLDEVTKYHFETGAGNQQMAGTVLITLMNKQKYNSLPADLKAILDRNSGLALSEVQGRAFDEVINQTRLKVLRSGAKINLASPVEMDALKKATAVVEEEWIKEATAKGLDGKALAAAAHTLAAPAKAAPAKTARK